VPIGIQDKKAKTVFNAIHEWATCYGPSATFNISQLNRIHGDYDTVFRSEEIIQLARQSNINISYAAPRHQEQNGICEASWKNVRKLAFSFLNDAQVDMSFFHCALEQEWKVHSILPHMV
jgi:transposase InsO family protein